MKRPFQLSRGLLAAVMGICLLGLASAASADINWGGSDGWWDDVTKWDLNRQPDTGDIVHLETSPNVTCNYYNTLHPFAVLKSLQIGDYYLGTFESLSMWSYNHPLYADEEIIGTYGGGRFSQNTGTNTVGVLRMGQWASGRGQYDLNNGVVLVTNFENIGEHGTATFHHVGGTHTFAGSAGALTLGTQSNGLGTYQLRGGTLSASAASIHIGEPGQGTFDQSGGICMVQSLALGLLVPGGMGGYWQGTGSYLLSGASSMLVVGSPTFGGSEYVGHNATATFVQTGGLHAVSTWGSGEGLIVGYGTLANGTYSMSGGTLVVSDVETIGREGTGRFIQSGGRHDISTNFYVGAYAGSNGSYTLNGSGASFSVPQAVLGYLGTGTFTQSLGSAGFNSLLYMGLLSGGKGNYLLSGGTMTAPALLVAYQGIGSFTQTAGYANATTLSIGEGASGVGVYDMRGPGDLTVTAMEYVGSLGHGTFLQSGGVHSIGNTLYIGYSASYGVFTKTAGVLQVPTAINRGYFDHSGGTLAISSTMTNYGQCYIGGIQAWATGATFTNATGGQAFFLSDAGPFGKALNMDATQSGATVTLAASQHLRRLDIGAGSRVYLTPGGNKVINTNVLTNTGGRLDLSDGDMVIDYPNPESSPLTWVRGQIQSARASGNWSGTGITTSLGDANHYALGYGEASAIFGRFPATFSGETIDSTTVLVKYTYYGDANLDGQVDISDLARLATGWQTSKPWTNGDFDYSGFVDISDLALLATNWQAGVGAPLGMSLDQAIESVGLSRTLIPEPAALAAWGVVGIFVLRSRKRIS